MSFDPKCHELAEHFLPEGASDRLLNELAQHVQDSVEEWLSDEAFRIETDLQRRPS